MQEQQSKLASNSIPAVFKKHPLLRMLWRFGFHLLLSCGIIWMLLGWMFLFAKGPAYIFFDESSAHSDLSKLHSQSICLSADTVMADIEDGAQINTQIYGRSIALSAPSLSDWMGTVLQKNLPKNAYLLLEGNAPWGFTIQHSSTDGIARYHISNALETTVNPLVSANISGEFEQLQIFPQTSSGSPFESFVFLESVLDFIIPNDADVQVYIVYSDNLHNTVRIQITRDILPKHQTLDADTWSFALNDSSILVHAPGNAPLTFRTLGKYALKLSCVGVEKIQGYLTGTMLFQNTSSPKDYTLVGQLVEITSRTRDLNLILCRDLRTEPLTNDILSINGEATQMNISGVDPFPNLRMWYRENIYIAPVSLLSVVITTIGLTFTPKPRKVRVKRKHK